MQTGQSIPRYANIPTPAGKRARVFRELLSHYSVDLKTWYKLLAKYQETHQLSANKMRLFKIGLGATTFSEDLFTRALLLLKPMIGENEVFELMRRHIEIESKEE